MKVNLQSPIPTSFYITVANYCENDAGMRLCKFTFTIISSLPCLHTFWHAIPTSFYICNVFSKSCVHLKCIARQTKYCRGRKGGLSKPLPMGLVFVHKSLWSSHNLLVQGNIHSKAVYGVFKRFLFITENIKHTFWNL